jgi:hypothetical protein
MAFLSHLVSQYEADDFKKIVIKREGDIPLRAEAICIIDVQSSSNNAASNYSGSTGRSRKYRVYLSKGGNLLIKRVDESQWQGERDRFLGYVFKSVEEIKECSLFKGGWLERDLLSEIEETCKLEVGETVE